MATKSARAAGEATSLLAAPEPSPMPWMLRSKWHTVASVVFLTLALGFTQGPNTSWELLQPIMLDDGVYLCGVANATSTATRQEAGTMIAAAAA